MQSTTGLRQVTFVLLVAMVYAPGIMSACTPIHDIHRAGSEADGGGGAAHGGEAGADADAATGMETAQGKAPDTSAPCEADGMVACAAQEGIARVICSSRAWTPYTDCKSSERCVTVSESVGGACKPLANECAGRDPGVAFCDGRALRLCDNPTAPTSVACGANSSCRMLQGVAKCACVTGAVDRGNGCELSNTCSPSACDPMTTCVEDSGQRSCSACPVGYAGDGQNGCSPLLTGLGLSCGALNLPLTQNQFAYHIDAPLFCQALTITPAAPDGVDINVNGHSLGGASTWTSGPLELGDNPLSIVVTAASALSSRYDVTLTRSGKQEAFLKARNAGNADRLGASVAIDNGTIVAGAPYEDGAAGGVNADPASGTSTDSGAAYVFARQGSQWVQEALLKADTPRAGEFFGASVAILGDIIAVGATGNDPTTQPAANAITGAVYLFKRSGTSWAQITKISADDTASSDMFGFQVLLTTDKLLVTAPFESSKALKSGAAYVFARQADAVQQSAKLKSSRPYAYAAWGTGLAYDGSTIAVGAFSDGQSVENAGTASVFTQQGGAWQEQQFLQQDKPTQGATFGLSMAVLGDTLMVGAPRWGHYVQTPSGEVYVFKRSGDHWTQTAVLTAFSPRASDYFGSSVLLTPTLLLIGANGDASSSGGVQANASDNATPDAGAVYFYERSGDQFVKPIFIKPASPKAGTAFGVVLGLSGGLLAAGAAYDGDDDSGAVYLLR